MNERCAGVQELMPWLLDGSLTSHEIVTALDHISTCHTCKRELVFLTRASKAADNVWNRRPTRAFLGRLWTRLEQQTREPQSEETQLDDVVVKQGLVRTTLQTIGYIVTPLGFAQDVVRLAYQSMLRAFSQLLGAVTQ